MPLQLRPNPAAPGVPTLALRGDRLAVDGVRDFPAMGVVLAVFTYRIRNARTRGLDRHNVMIESRDGAPLAWLGSADVPLYAVDELANFAAAAGIPLIDRGEVQHAVTSGLPDQVRVGPGTSKVGAVVAPLRQWILCLVLVAGAAPLVLVAVEHWSRWAWVLLVPGWFFGSFFTVGAIQGTRHPEDPAWVRRTRLRCLLAAVLTAAAAVTGALGYRGASPVPGWVGVWVAAAGLVATAGWTLALQGTFGRRAAALRPQVPIDS